MNPINKPRKDSFMCTPRVPIFLIVNSQGPPLSGLSAKCQHHPPHIVGRILASPTPPHPLFFFLLKGFSSTLILGNLFSKIIDFHELSLSTRSLREQKFL
jgi:hypothetical protein